MWILFLAVASFFAFLGILLLLWLADMLEARNRTREPKVRVQPPLTVLCIAQVPVDQSRVVESVPGERSISAPAPRRLQTRCTRGLASRFDGCSRSRLLVKEAT